MNDLKTAALNRLFIAPVLKSFIYKLKAMTERVGKIQTIQRVGDAESPVQIGLSETGS